jgi:AhpD family alkylhydroperoxidase
MSRSASSAGFSWVLPETTTCPKEFPMTILFRSLTRGLLLLMLLLVPAAAKAQSADAAKTRADIQKTFGFVPAFIQQTPDEFLPGAWSELVSLQMNPNTALSGEIKELIGLGVAAQIPCRYCIYGHTEFAKLNGADSTELGEALAMAALTRHWSTFFNGVQLDENKFRAEIGQVVNNAKHAAATGVPEPTPMAVVDAESALADIRRTLGFVPGFIKRFPSEGLPGAWLAMKNVELNPATKLSGKNKSLIGLAVAAQIPCKYCIVADTEFAKLEGATEREITDAVAMASVVRQWSTILNGVQVDETQYRKDVDRLVAGAKQATKAQARR